MTITFPKKPTQKGTQWKQGNAKEAREKRLRANTNRRLRRERINAAKQGAIIPYEPRSQPQDPDAPKLTNYAKRMVRKRKKYAAELAEQGLTVEEGGPTYLKTKKKKNTPATELDAQASGPTDLKTKKEENTPATELDAKASGPTDLKTKKKKNNITPAPELGAEDNDYDDTPSAAGNHVSDQSEVTSGKTKKKIKKKSKKIEESTATAENSGDLLVPKEENEVKLEVDWNDEEMATDEANIHDTPNQANKKKKEGKNAKKQRFVLFVGNLTYDTTEEEIASHFQKIGKIMSIRVSKNVDKALHGQNKGFAHLDVGDEDTYLKALSMHHSKLKGRRINVEYSTCQNKEMRGAQKEQTRVIKEAIARGDILDLANPSKSKLKKKKKGKREKDPAKMVWL